MKFKCFYEFINSDIERLNLSVNDFIKFNEESGYHVVKQETLMQPHPESQDLMVLVSVWMEKKEDRT
ncbi:hypothetical protein BCS42_02270 [Crenothrix sp. D3]|nr:hypothetical protein BCS42_02270 [Crenothrix sp. D3]